MNNFDVLDIEQTLHGYFNGHHLLASSIKLSSKSEKIMSVLSDLSGPEINKDFTEYFTGYLLKDDQYYVLAKTWYASEMKRPGCVWTHSLLIKVEDLEKVQYCNFFVDLFIKPTIEFDKSIYSKKSKVILSKARNMSKNDLSLHKLKFLIWSIFNHDKSIIISSNTSFDYTKEAIFLWENYSDGFCNKLSFCTGSLANRRIEDQSFDLQIVPFSLTRSILRTSKSSIVVETPINNTNFPLWVDDIANQLLSQDNKEFKKFVEIFGFKYNRKQYFKRFAELYTKANIIRGLATISDLFSIIDQLFDECDCNIIKNTTIKKLIAKNNIEWFENQDFIIIFIELCTQANVNHLKFDEIELSKTIEKIWLEDKIASQQIFKELINNNINNLGEYLIDFYAHFITPSLLPRFTDFNIRSCNVLISINYELALCVDLWHQAKEFQLQIIDCIRNKDIPFDKSVCIITAILDNSKFDLYDQIYKVFKNISIPVFLDWSIKADYKNKDNVRNWLCKNNSYEYISWLSTKEIPYDLDFLLLMISFFDPYSKEVLQFGKNPWQNILHQINYNNVDDDTQTKIVQFFLPIILLTDDEFSNDIVSFVYSIVYTKLAQEQFDNREWEKLEPFLPRLPWFKNWDKCKRLKKAIKAKGYQF